MQERPKEVGGYQGRMGGGGGVQSRVSIAHCNSTFALSVAVVEERSLLKDQVVVIHREVLCCRCYRVTDLQDFPFS